MTRGTVNKKWFQARLAEKELSGRRFSSMLGLHPTDWSKIMVGTRGVSADEAADIARVLGVPVPDVLKQLGVDVPRDTRAMVPIVGIADATGAVGPVKAGAPRRAERPVGLPDNVSAVLVQAPGQPWDGWVVYYLPAMSVAPDAVGRMAVTHRGTGGMSLGVLRQGYERGTWSVGPICESAVGREGPLDWAAPVIWIRA